MFQLICHLFIREKDQFLDYPKPTVQLVLRLSKNPQRFQQQAGDYQVWIILNFDVLCECSVYLLFAL